MQELRNAIRRDAESIVGSIAQPRDGIIASVDPSTHSVRVRIMPEGTLTGWIPDCSAVSAGGGYGVVAPPAEGDQVHISFAHGDGDHPRIVGRVFSAIDKPPVSPATGKAVQPREFAVFVLGAFLHFTADGTVHGSASRWNLHGDLHVDGEVLDKRGSLDRLRQAYDAHVHPGVKRGGDNTDTTSVPDSEATEQQEP